LLFFYIVGPFAISAQGDHLLRAEQNVVKFVDYDVADSLIPCSFQFEPKTVGLLQQLIPSEIQLSSGSKSIKPRSGRAPPVIVTDALFG
jgi:hypothetical protein